MGFHVTLYGPGVFLRLKKDLRESYRNANCILTILHQMNSLEEYGVTQTLTHLMPTSEKTSKNMWGVDFMGHAFWSNG